MKKTVLITGASRGIGAACAKEFAKRGYFVAINYFKSKSNAVSLLKEIKEFGGIADLFYGDVSNEQDVENIYSKLKNSFGLPGVLVNNAAVAQQKLLTETTTTDWNFIFQNNVNSVFFCCKKFLPYMIKHRFGKIVNISSIWGLVGSSCEVAYSASKAAIIGFTKALAKEVALSNVLVNCVAPGVVDTRMNNSLSHETVNSLKNAIPCSRFATTKEVASAVLFLADESSSYITGQVLGVDGGFMG